MTSPDSPHFADVSASLDLPAARVRPFPRPSTEITEALDALQLASAYPPINGQELRGMAELPRPWDPAGCPPHLASQVWVWLDGVAAWINEQHLWTLTTPGVPECWPLHPHLAHDLAVVAAARSFAGYAVTPVPLLEWHQYTLPGFLDRVAERMTGGCAPGRHAESPRVGRDDSFRRARAETRHGGTATPVET